MRLKRYAVTFDGRPGQHYWTRRAAERAAIGARVELICYSIEDERAGNTDLADLYVKLSRTVDVVRQPIFRHQKTTP